MANPFAENETVSGRAGATATFGAGLSLLTDAIVLADCDAGHIAAGTVGSALQTDVLAKALTAVYAENETLRDRVAHDLKIIERIGDITTAATTVVALAAKTKQTYFPAGSKNLI